MKSRTSFFNTTVFRKDITRFAPAWGLYLTGILLLMLTIFTEDDYHLADTMSMTIGVLSIVNIGYALVCGALLFGDLFNHKLCNALHAMPLRREGWFVTHLVSGLLFSVVPNLIVALCLIPRLDSYWPMAFVWWGGMTATYLFFFGAAVLSALCTGSRFAMTLVYGLINFLSILLMWTVQFLYKPLLYGIEIDQEPFVFFSPVSYLCTHELSFAYFSTNDGWPYVTGIALVGVAMLVAALFLYRRRHLETAGDFITVRFLSPVFLVLYTLAAGMALFIFSSVFSVDRDYLFLAVGVTAGFITGRMLLRRTVRVFKPATFIGLAVMMAVLFGSLGLAKLDVFGIVRWVPEAEAVKTVSIRYTDDEVTYTTPEKAEIEELVRIHEGIVAAGGEDNRWSSRIDLTYTLQDGSVVTRCYPVDYSTGEGQAIARLLSKPEYVLDTQDVSTLWETVNYITVDKHSTDNTVFVREEAQSLLDAIIADCEAGLMNQDWNYHTDDTWGYLILEKAGDRDVSVLVWNSAVNTVTWLKEHGINP